MDFVNGLYGIIQEPKIAQKMSRNMITEPTLADRFLKSFRRITAPIFRSGRFAIAAPVSN